MMKNTSLKWAGKSNERQTSVDEDADDDCKDGVMMAMMKMATAKKTRARTTTLTTTRTATTPNRRHRKRPRKCGGLAQHTKATQNTENAETPQTHNDVQDILHTAIAIANEKRHRTQTMSNPKARSTKQDNA